MSSPLRQYKEHLHVGAADGYTDAMRTEGAPLIVSWQLKKCIERSRKITFMSVFKIKFTSVQLQANLGKTEKVKTCVSQTLICFVTHWHVYIVKLNRVGWMGSLCSPELWQVQQHWTLSCTGSADSSDELWPQIRTWTCLSSCSSCVGGQNIWCFLYERHCTLVNSASFVCAVAKTDK